MKTIIEMKVDDIKRSEKGKDSCVLKCAEKEPTIDGVEVEVTMTIKADGISLFGELGVPHVGNRIDIVLKDAAQQKLGE